MGRLPPREPEEPVAGTAEGVLGPLGKGSGDGRPCVWVSSWAWGTLSPGIYRNHKEPLDGAAESNRVPLRLHLTKKSHAQRSDSQYRKRTHPKIYTNIKKGSKKVLGMYGCKSSKPVPQKMPSETLTEMEKKKKLVVQRDWKKEILNIAVEGKKINI